MNIVNICIDWNARKAGSLQHQFEGGDSMGNGALLNAWDGGSLCKKAIHFG